MQRTRSANRQPRPPRGEAGFTIMELLIVMGISLFGLAGLMSVYSSASSANQGMGHSSEAIDVCERSMEVFRSMRVAEIEAVVGYGAITAAGWGPTPHVDGDFIGRNGVVFGRQVSAIESAGNAGLVRITTEVTWTADGSDPAAAAPADVHRVTLEMIRSRVGIL